MTARIKFFIFKLKAIKGFVWMYTSKLGRDIFYVLQLKDTE